MTQAGPQTPRNLPLAKPVLDFAPLRCSKVMMRPSTTGSTHLFAALSIFAAVLAATPAQACRMDRPIDLQDVRMAEIVVVGRISNYRIVRSGRPPRAMASYARFDIQVEEVLLGTAPRRMTVSWYNSTFALPDQLATGPLLFALRRTTEQVGSRPPVTVLQRPCSSPFMFEARSTQARQLRRLLTTRTR